MINIKYILISLIFTVSCQMTDNSSNTGSEIVATKHKETINQLLNFFNTNGYTPKYETYYSEIDNSGKVISEKVYNVALSRLIYGLSYSSIINRSNLKRAEEAVNFQIANLTTQDSIGGHFISYIDLQSNTPDNSTSLDIWQQAYGLCGLTEFYRNDPSDQLLSSIHQFHNAFVSRFHDNINGGFYGNCDINSGAISGSKTLQALVYPITAYMENLWWADAANRSKYEPYLKENLKIVSQKVWNREMGWVNVKFDDMWNVSKHNSADDLAFTVNPGHNFQVATLLLRTKDWDFITDNKKAEYKKLGLEILTRTLKQPIYPVNDLSQGFFSEVNPITSQVIDNRKTWWQHAEALVALSLAGEDFKDQLSDLEKFYFNSFTDTKNGGEYSSVDKDNNPQINELKGSIGKSAYHTIEMIRFLNSDNK